MQKKILIGLIIGAVAMAQVLPLAVLAQTPVPPKMPDYCEIRTNPSRVGLKGCLAGGDDATGKCEYSVNEQCGMCCLISTALYITDWIFVGLIVLVIAFVLIGAFNIMTAAGNAEKVTAGRNYIMYAAIGFAIALLAKAVPAIIKFVIATPGT